MIDDWRRWWGEGWADAGSECWCEFVERGSNFEESGGKDAEFVVAASQFWMNVWPRITVLAVWRA